MTRSGQLSFSGNILVLLQPNHPRPLSTGRFHLDLSPASIRFYSVNKRLPNTRQPFFVSNFQNDAQLKKLRLRNIHLIASWCLWTNPFLWLLVLRFLIVIFDQTSSSNLFIVYVQDLFNSKRSKISTVNAIIGTHSQTCL